MVSTNQADPQCFLLQSFMNINGTTLIFSSPPFSADPQKPQTLTASKLSLKIFDQNF